VRRKSPKKSSKLNPYSRNAAEKRIDCRRKDYNGRHPSPTPARFCFLGVLCASSSRSLR
jgi:hypothetical protein